jgi:hypothetical protein
VDIWTLYDNKLTKESNDMPTHPHV